MRIVELFPAARKVVRELLEVGAGEEVLVIADAETDPDMISALASELGAVEAAHSVVYVPIHETRTNTEFPAFVTEGLNAVDVVIGITTATASACYGRRLAELKIAGRLRLMSMVLRDYHDFTGGAAHGNYPLIKRRGDALGEIWSRGESVRLTTPNGTDLTATIKGEMMVPNLGYATRPGESGAFPDGEQSQMPNEGSAEGIIVVDGPLYRFGIPETPLEMRVKSGRVTEVIGSGKVADRLRSVLDKYVNSDNVAEIGIGLNERAELNGRFEEEKKALGTAHVALGDNTSYGGTVNCDLHMDMVMYKPTFEIDGRSVMVEGRLLLDDA